MIKPLIYSTLSHVTSTHIIYIFIIYCAQWVVSESVLQNNIIMIIIVCFERAADYHGNANLTAPQAPKVHVSKLSHVFKFLRPRLSTKLVWFLDLVSGILLY